MRFHLLGLANVPTNYDRPPDGFATKIMNLGYILKSIGQVVFYGGEGSTVECDEFVQCISDADRKRVYGEHGYDRGSRDDAAHQIFNANSVREINARKEPKDFLICAGGTFHQAIANGVGLMAVEPGIGYEGVFAKYRVFESYAWMHHIYGLRQEKNGGFYDAVIPGFFDDSKFPFQEKKDDYFLFVGRYIPRKGLGVAIEVTRYLGAKLIVAGSGEWDFSGPENAHVENLGVVDHETRNRLMGHARAVLMPTLYIEPFGNVAVESMLCGTPVITTDWGGFTETVNQGVTGFRCRTFREFIAASMAASSINPRDCREWAVSRYSIGVIAPQYETYFKRLLDLWESGWYQLNTSPMDDVGIV